MTRIPALALTVFGLFALPGHASAACVEEKETVVLQDAEASLKSYRCTVDGKTIKITFHVLSSVAAGMVLGESPYSAGLALTLGTPQVAANEVSALYLEIFRKFAQPVAIFDRFGEVEEGAGRFLSTELGGDGEGGLWQDQVEGGTLKVLFTGEGESSYPMIDEWASLKTKVIPPGLKFYYRETCTDPDCNEIGPALRFWRGMTPDDVARYEEKRDAMNALIASEALTVWLGHSADPYMVLLQDLTAASGGLPEDFIILELADLTGEETCDEEPAWSFSFAPRDMALAVAQVTNLSEAPVTLDGIYGTVDAAKGLHPPAAFVTGSGGLIDITPQALAPGESAVVPLRVEFPRPKALASWGLMEDTEIETSDAFFEEYGTSGFEASGDAYDIPDPQDYAFGPEIAVSGVRLDGQRVDLAPRSANFLEVIASSEVGSCPYLLSWNGADESWTEHGKILHEAKGARNEASKRVRFAGFLPKFKIEEREPERFSIDHAALIVALKDGNSLRLEPAHLSLKARDRNYLHIYWGRALEVAFTLPDGVGADEVETSTLEITGFYQRYSELWPAADAGARLRPAILDGAAPSGGAKLCPARSLAAQP